MNAKAAFQPSYTIMRARGPNIGTCTLNTLATIAAALGVHVRELFDES